MATAREQFLAQRGAQKSANLDTTVPDRAPGFTDASVTAAAGARIRPSANTALATHGQKLRALSDELGGRITHLGGASENVDALRKAASHVDTANRHITSHLSAIAAGDHAAAADHFANAATHLSAAANSIPKVKGKDYSNLTSDSWSPKGQQWHDSSDKDSVSLENIHPKINKISNDLWTGLKSVGAQLPEKHSAAPRVSENTTATPSKDIKLGVSTVLDSSLTPDTIAAPPHRESSLKTGETYAKEELKARRAIKNAPAQETLPTPLNRTEAPATQAAIERNAERPAPKMPASLKERGETGRRQWLDLTDQAHQHWHENNRRVSSYTASDYKNADGTVNKDAAAAAAPSADDMKEFGGDRSAYFTSQAYKNPAAYAQRHGLKMRDTMQLQTTPRADTRLTGLGSVSEADKVEPKSSRSEVFQSAALPETNWRALGREIGNAIQEKATKNAKVQQRSDERIAAREGVLRRRAEPKPTFEQPSEKQQADLAKRVAPRPSPEGQAATQAAQVREAGRNTPAAPNRGPEATAIARTRASAAEKARKSRMEAFLGGQAK